MVAVVGANWSTDKRPLICKTVAGAVEPSRNRNCSLIYLKGDQSSHQETHSMRKDPKVVVEGADPAGSCLNHDVIILANVIADPEYLGTCRIAALAVSCINE